MKRAAISDHLAGVLGPDEGITHAEVINLPAMQAVTIALDQLVTRVEDFQRRYGTLDPDVHRTNDDQFAHAERQVRILEAAAAAGRSMIDHVRGQVPPMRAEARPPVAEAVTDSGGDEDMVGMPTQVPEPVGGDPRPATRQRKS